jgi:LemA protein
MGSIGFLGILLAFIGILIVGLIGVVLWGIGVNNNLVALRNRFKNAFAQIDVALQRRYDLIPNLVNVAKGYMKHEKDTLEAVIQARNSAFSAAKNVAGDPADPEAMKKLKEAESQLTGSLGRLMAISEAYPDLKADSQMTALMEELTSTENKISFARQAFNDAVTRYNTAREVFPSSIIAGFRNFQEAELFEVDNAEVKKAPNVSFE